jgi:hypothetical protein
MMTATRIGKETGTRRMRIINASTKTMKEIPSLTNLVGIAASVAIKHAPSYGKNIPGLVTFMIGQTSVSKSQITRCGFHSKRVYYAIYMYRKRWEKQS